MGKYRIWCRIDEIGAGQHLAVVSAIPDVAGTPKSSVESESRLLAHRPDAVEACALMVISTRTRIEARGDEVTAVEMV